MDDSTHYQLTHWSGPHLHMCLCSFTQYVFVEGASEVDVDQLSVVQSQTQDLSCEPEVVQVVWIHRGVTVGLKSGACRLHTHTNTHLHSP